MTEYNDQYWDDLGERWVRAGCSWRGGILWQRFEGGRETHGGRINYHMPESMPGAIPNLRDPATAGCLLADVREAYGDPTTSRGHYRWILTEQFGPQQRRHPPAPEWFELPAEWPERETERRGLWEWSRSYERATYIVEAAIKGRLGLAPWQRGQVWSTEQQIALLDSMMKGHSIGPIMVWTPDKDVDGRPFPGLEFKADEYGARLVVDGQQRISALVRAWRCELDDWRWNGHEWTQGRGFLVPSQVVRSGMALHHHDDEALSSMALYEQLDLMGADEGTFRRVYKDLERVAMTDVDILGIEGTAEHVVESYRRLAVMGTPHSVEDLRAMTDWLEGRQLGDDCPHCRGTGIDPEMPDWGRPVDFGCPACEGSGKAKRDG